MYGILLYNILLYSCFPLQQYFRRIFFLLLDLRKWRLVNDVRFIGFVKILKNHKPSTTLSTISELSSKRLVPTHQLTSILKLKYISNKNSFAILTKHKQISGKLNSQRRHATGLWDYAVALRSYGTTP